MKVIKPNYEQHQILTPVCTLGFCDLESVYRYDPKSPGYYRAQLVFDDYSDLEDRTVDLPKLGRLSASLVEAINSVKEAQWGPDESDWPEEEYPLITDGDTVTDKNGQPVASLAGKWQISPKTGEEYPPVFLGADGKPCDPKQFKKGDQVQAQILVRPYVINRKKQGVTLRLVALKFVAKGAGSNSVWFEETPDLTEESGDLW